MIDLVRDVLDTQVIDREGRPMGKVDGIALELGADGPPRVAYLEVDSARAWRRLGEHFGRWATAAQRRWGGGACRFTWSQVRDFGIDLEIDLDAEQTYAFALERWLRKKLP
jgi:hypothetical protein